MKKIPQVLRNPLDYILTDTMPVEVSEIFTYTYLYDYLQNNRRQLDSIQTQVAKSEKNIFDKKIIPFDGRQNWQTRPLTYDITKPDGKSLRKLSIPQPLSIVNLYFFISLYQKDILNRLSNPSFSVRFHQRNNNLYYSNIRGRIIDYQYGRDRKKKKFIEQTGRYFSIQPFTTIHDLQRSENWHHANLNFRLFCKLDYKRCFDSIYTHEYNKIVSKDTVDAKSAKNSSLFTVIDRVLQNINGSSSNGVIIGPEFSRMIAEILLQQIDNEVHASLSSYGYVQNRDYIIMRFVDDIYIFCNGEELRDQVIRLFDQKSHLRRLEINDQKTEKQTTPFKNSSWVEDTMNYLALLRPIIRTNRQVREREESYRIVCSEHDLGVLKEEFERLLAKHKDDEATPLRMTNFTVTSVYNLISETMPKDFSFFKHVDETKGNKTVRRIIDFAFFLYSHSVTFENTQKLISILYYLNREQDLKAASGLQRILEKYEKKIASAKYSEYINLLVAFKELGVQFTSHCEIVISSAIQEADDPIALATFLYYSQYNQSFAKNTADVTAAIIEDKISCIVKIDRGSAQLYAEFWYALIFYQCPYIDAALRTKCTDVIQKAAVGLDMNTTTPAYLSANLIKDFVLASDSKGFIAWNQKGARVLEEITYRTSTRTIFRRRGAGDLGASF